MGRSTRASRGRVERERGCAALLADPATTPERLSRRSWSRRSTPPTYSRGFGTLYTAVYRPAAGTVSYHWPGSTWTHSFDHFREGTHGAAFREPAAA